jgi:uncharacterized membrane protein YfcA
MDLDLLLIISFVLIITFSSMTQSSMGFGFAMVAMTVLPMMVGIRDANVIVSIASLIPSAYAAWVYRKGLDSNSFASSTIAAVCTLPLGLWALKMVSADLLTRSTGLAILFIAVEGLFHRTSEPKELKHTRLWSIIAGACSGVLSGALSIGGPPIVAFATRQSWSPKQFKAFVALFLLIVTTTKVAGMTAVGLVNSQVLWLSLIAIPFCFAGGKLGVWISDKIDPKTFRIIVLCMLTMISLGMIVRGSPERDTSPAQESSATEVD